MLGRWRACALLLIATLIPAGVARAQTQVQTSPFDITGVIQSATLDSLCVAHPFCGGTLGVNGITVTVPTNALVRFPSTRMTWEEIFTNAPLAYRALGESGLASADDPPPLSSFQAHVVGNTVGGTPIAALVQVLTSVLGTGVITAIDYTRRELLVGGAVGVPLTRVRINNRINGPDPLADPRFTADEDNPTIRAKTGYPMCVPRFDPAAATDPLCPQTNRELDPFALTRVFQTSFTFPASPFAGAMQPDPFEQAPLEVGDSITYNGSLSADPNGGTFVSAWGIVADLGLFTAPATSPTYFAIDSIQLGVGKTVGEILEAQDRISVEGFTTDPTQPVLLFAIDVNCVGGTSDRGLGTAVVDLGPPFDTGMKGKWHVVGADTVPPAVTFLPATREMAVSSSSLTAGTTTIVPGQYRAPVNEYLFPEQVVLGTPEVPLTFEEFPFLANGSGPYIPFGGSVPGGSLGQLSPWPGATAPPPCGAPPTGPTANAGPDQTVASEATFTLDGRASVVAPPFSLSWAQVDGAPVVLTPTLGAVVTVKAPKVPFGSPAPQLVFRLSVMDRNLLGTTDDVAITVNPEPCGTELPAITCPADVSANAQTGVKTVIVTYPAPTVVDPCPGVTVSCSPASGSAFPAGPNTVTCSATGTGGVTAICSFHVNVYRCPLSKEFWEEHTKSWPVTSPKLGSQTYTAAELRTLIKNMSSSDASLILARRLIATLLNLANGSNPAPAAAALADAQSRLAGFAGKLPYKVTTSSATGKAMLADAAVLKSYNRGMLTSGCPPTREADDD